MWANRCAVAASSGLVVVLACGCSGSNGHPAPSATKRPTTGSTVGSTPRSAVTSTSGPLPEVAIVAGKPGGRPPCASTHTAGGYQADIVHTERAPQRALAIFTNGVRWAVCGDTQAFGGDLLNLRSVNNGTTWRVTDSHVGASLSHAGDRLNVTLVNINVGTIHAVSLVTDYDTSCTTSTGGQTWRCSTHQPPPSAYPK